MFTSRLRCHFCGTRSPYSKDVLQFQCTACEALNFFDGKGNVIDTPAAVASHNTQMQLATRPQLTSTQQPVQSTAQQHSPVFCRTCVQNQLLYTQALANYLPDEDHPRYREMDAALPRYRKELEKRYPQVCKKCAPLAQSNINRADYYSKTQLISKLASERQARKGRPTARPRDSPKKKVMRLLLRLAGTASATALLAQVAFHIYGMLLNLFPSSSTFNATQESYSELLIPSCTREALSFRFELPCYQFTSSIIPQTIIVSAILIWYNPGLSAWSHHTIRVEAVRGQRQYFWTHVLIIVIRYMAWYQLSNPLTTATLDRKQLAGLHFATALFITLFHVLSTKAIKPVAWKMRGNVMPRPEDRDVLGLTAGPELEHHTPKASEKDPLRYLRKPTTGTFDINSLAPKAARPPRKAPSKASNQWSESQFPSPEDTEESDADDTDAMETDFNPVMRTSFRSPPPSTAHQLRSGTHYSAAPPPPQGWTDMRGEIFSLQDQLRAEAEQRARQPPAAYTSPFRGKLPLAPMSMERRLRNPIAQAPLEPPQVPLSQQKDFFAQMSTGIRPPAAPAGKGANLELRKSTWTLPGDVRETGLEDLMAGNSFRIDDEPEAGQGTKAIGWFSSLLGRND